MNMNYYLHQVHSPNTIHVVDTYKITIDFRNKNFHIRNTIVFPMYFPPNTPFNRNSVTSAL